MENWQHFIDRLNALRQKMRRMPLPEARQSLENFFYIPLDKREKVGKIIDEKIAGPESSIPLRLYIPDGKPPHPLLLFFHWGGWVYGSIEDSDPLCRKLCNRCSSIVVSVDYRLAPEHPYPAALEDCFTATTWTLKHGAEFLGNIHKTAVIGESAGGNLAAGVSLKMKDRAICPLALQVLIYPILSYERWSIPNPPNVEQEFLTEDSIRWFWKQYLPSKYLSDDPLIFPLKVENLEHLPKTILATAEYDPLRPEALAYARHLRAYKKSVLLLDYPEAVHGFLNLPLANPASEKALNEICRDIKILLTP
jgi:acetyl esterase